MNSYTIDHFNCKITYKKYAIDDVLNIEWKSHYYIWLRLNNKN